MCPSWAAGSGAGLAQGTAGEPLPRLQEIRFPVGGKRFRPTIEEFLLFLHRERLFRDWIRPGWRSTVDASLVEWETRQARSTVRRLPDAAVDQLRSSRKPDQAPARAHDLRERDGFDQERRNPCIRRGRRVQGFRLEPERRIELLTCSLRVSCSTD